MRLDTRDRARAERRFDSNALVFKEHNKMRKAWLFLGAAAVFGVLSASGCGGEARQEPAEASEQEGPGRAAAPGHPRIGVDGASAAAPSWEGGQAQAEDGPPANDTCMGQPVILTAGTGVHLNGTLAGANDDYTTFCADGSPDPGNPDVVYQLNVSSEVSLTVSLSASGFIPALSLRLSACTVEAAGDTCLDLGGSAEHKQASLPAGTYWVVVDSADGNTGPFTLDFYPTAPTCGDGIVNAGEQCDPGPAVSDDGCFDPGSSQQCKYGEPPSDASMATCPGKGNGSSARPVFLSLDPQNPSIDVQGPFNNGTGARLQENFITADPNICGWPATGPEHVFHVQPQANGTLHARIGHDAVGNPICTAANNWANCADYILYMRSSQCAPLSPQDASQQLACQDFDPNGQEVLEISSPVTAATDYWVFVDGLDDQWGIGTYYLETWLVP
jgi:cysteine-rich repeat protein